MTKRSKPGATARYVTEAALAVSLAALTGAAFAAAPGYVTSGGGDYAVTDSSGNCWKSGGWTASDAREPCDAVPHAAAPAAATVAEEAPKPVEPAPVALAEPQVIQQLNLSTDVLFEFDSATLKEAGKKKLDELAQTAQGANVEQVQILGYADRIGSEKYNQELSQKRAEAVKAYLAQAGAAPDRVQAEGRGEDNSVTGDECNRMGPARKSNKKLVACLQPDRRVEIQVLGSRETASGETPSSAGTSTAPAGTGSSSGNESNPASGTDSGSSTTR